MAAEDDLVLRLLREMGAIRQHVEDIEASVARAPLETRIEFGEKS